MSTFVTIVVAEGEKVKADCELFRTVDLSGVFPTRLEQTVIFRDQWKPAVAFRIDTRFRFVL